MNAFVNNETTGDVSVLDEETITPLMVDKMQTCDDPSSTHVTEGILNELKSEGTMPVEAGKEVM